MFGLVAKGPGFATYLCCWKAKQWQVLGHAGFDRPGGVMMTYIATSTSLSTPSHRNRKFGALEDARMSS